MGKLEQDNSLNLGFNVSNMAKSTSDALGFSVTVERRTSLYGIMKSSFSDVVSDFSLFRYRMNLRLHKKKKTCGQPALPDS